MAATIPPPTSTAPNTIQSPCAGINYSPPLPSQGITYEFNINSTPGPFIDLPMIIPETNITIPLNVWFNSKPIFEAGCKNEYDRMIFGIPCDLTGCKKKVCVKKWGVKVCAKIPYPCPKYAAQLYLVRDDIKKLYLFTIPKIGFSFKAESSTNTRQIVGLSSNSPIVYWIDLLVQMGVDRNGLNDVNTLLNRLITVAGKTLAYLLRQFILCYAGKSFGISLSIKISKLIMDIKLDLKELRLVNGSKKILVNNLTYTFKDIDILKLIQAEFIQFTISNTNFIIDYSLGTFTLDVTPIDMIISMLKNKINQLKTISSGLSLDLQKELEDAKDALTYVESLTEIGDYIPFINSPGINFFKNFIKSLQPKLLLILKICPVQGQVGICCKLAFDPTEYFKKIGDFLINNLKAGFDGYEKYIKIPSTIVDLAPNIITPYNNLIEITNKQISDLGKQGLELARDALNTDTQSFTSSLTFCAPL